MKIIAIALVLTISFTHIALSEIQAFCKVVTSTNGYTVPSGKVLVIEWVAAANIPEYVVVEDPAGAEAWYICRNLGGDVRLKYSIKLPSGFKVKGAAGSVGNLVSGLLIDNSDLLLVRSIPSEISLPSINAQALYFNVETQAKQDAHLLVEKSTNLKAGAWEIEPQAEVVSHRNGKTHEVKVPVADAKAFYRTIALKSTDG